VAESGDQGGGQVGGLMRGVALQGAEDGFSEAVEAA
jgi:hypothetical protein